MAHTQPGRWDPTHSMAPPDNASAMADAEAADSFDAQSPPRAQSVVAAAAADRKICGYEKGGMLSISFTKRALEFIGVPASSQLWAVAPSCSGKSDSDSPPLPGSRGRFSTATMEGREEGVKQIIDLAILPPKLRNELARFDLNNDGFLDLHELDIR